MMKAVMEAVFGASKASSKAAKWVPEAGAAFKPRGVYGGMGGTSVVPRAGEYFSAASGHTGPAFKGRNTSMSIVAEHINGLEKSKAAMEGVQTPPQIETFKRGVKNIELDPRGNQYFAHGRDAGIGGRLLDRLSPNQDLNRMTIDQAAERFAGFSQVAAARHLGKAPAWTGKPLKAPTPSRYAGNTSNLMKNTHNASSRRELFTTGGMLGSVFGGIESLASGLSGKRGNRIGR